MIRNPEQYTGDTIHRGTIKEGPWQYLSDLALRIGGELQLPVERSTWDVTVSSNDFYDLALERYGKIDQGGRAYGRLVRITEDQAKGWGFNSKMPKLIFRVRPDVSDKLRSWREERESYQQLELHTLSNYVDVVATMEARCTSETQRSRLYGDLGRGIGYGTVSFWREIVARHADDEKTF